MHVRTPMNVHIPSYGCTQNKAKIINNKNVYVALKLKLCSSSRGSDYSILKDHHYQ